MTVRLAEEKAAQQVGLGVGVGVGVEKVAD